MILKIKFLMESFIQYSIKLFFYQSRKFQFYSFHLFFSINCNKQYLYDTLNIFYFPFYYLFIFFNKMQIIYKGELFNCIHITISVTLSKFIVTQLYEKFKFLSPLSQNIINTVYIRMK
jgi:hypothetical protein